MSEQETLLYLEVMMMMNYELLLMKLKFYGIQGRAGQWFKS
jgi:hypothetical protein